MTFCSNILLGTYSETAHGAETARNMIMKQKSPMIATYGSFYDDNIGLFDLRSLCSHEL